MKLEMKKKIKWKKRIVKQLSKALSYVKAIAGDDCKKILMFSDFRSNDGKVWQNEWGGRLVINEKNVVYTPAIDKGDLYLYSGEDVVAAVSDHEIIDDENWFWGEDNRLRIFKDSKRIDPLTKIKRKNGNKD